ncbi:hypothetical protein CO652_08745 [Rhizobium sp. H4]|nr:hypothetical protein CO652_08745 [Rhizobium sp. H4]
MGAVQPSPGITEERSGRSLRDEATADAEEHAASPVRLARTPTTLSVIPGLDPGSTTEHAASISLQWDAFAVHLVPAAWIPGSSPGMTEERWCPDDAGEVVPE